MPYTNKNQTLITSFWRWTAVLCLILVIKTGTVASASSEDATVLVSHLSQHSVTGSITFTQLRPGEPVSIKADLKVAREYKGEYSWGIYEFPIDYTQEEYCHSRLLGRKPILNFDTSLNKLPLDEAEASEDPIISASLEYTSSELNLTGNGAVWGRGLVLEGPSRSRTCGSLMPVGKGIQLRSAEARFTSPVAGSVWFTSNGNHSSAETNIFTNLVHVSGDGKSSSHRWQLFITDVLDTDSDIHGSGCDFLQILYDTKKSNGDGCSKDDPGKCRDGDLAGKFGKVKVSRRESMFTKSYFHDINLVLPELEGTARSLFVVLYEAGTDKDDFFACAKVREVKTKVAAASFGHDSVTGDVTFQQVCPFFPTKSSVRLRNLQHKAGSYHVHQFPAILDKRDNEDNPCMRTGGHFNPFGIDSTEVVGAGGSMDKYEVGDLSGKYGKLTDLDEFESEVFDPMITLFGKNSVVGRTVIIHNSPRPSRWTCANIKLQGRPQVTAIATFTYPVAGRIIFRQPQDEPFEDTLIFVESLIYSDGNKNDTFDHKWHVHNNIPGRDYFNWTGRCLSAGGHFNPYKIDLEPRAYSECSNEHLPHRCEVGDLFHKHESLRVTGRARDSKKTVKFFTDSNLPLSGPHSIIGRSITIHDDHAPDFRGNRMACTPIMRAYRTKAVAKTWFGNGQVIPLKGRLEFIQASPMDPTHVLVDLHGLNGIANAYHVHQVSVQGQNEFPCTGEAIGGHFNPSNWDPSESPKPTRGTVDQYEVGDLSGKHGLLKDMQEIREIYNDTNLPLSGYNAVLGRSIVIHKKHKAERWACASIGWGFDPDEAREVKAIASFHHPNGFAWGYIRFSQVIYNDGSKSDTTMEIRLKYPGKFNTDKTEGHEWSIYVNPVGHDASVKFANARCTAAGYRWNPTHIQLAAPNDHAFYGEECGPTYPIRCEVGDLSGRHGRLNVGGRAYVKSDPLMTLQGEDWYTSAIGKSIVIHGPNGGLERMACANIEVDREIIKVASVRTKARFNLGTFLEESRAIMGVPEWFMFLDKRKTRQLHNGRCIQVEIHFAGPHAHKLEQDFNHLLRTGRLAGPSIPIPGYIPDPQRKTKLGYSECDSDKERPSVSTYNDLYGSYSSLSSASGLPVTSILTVIFVTRLLHLL